MAQTPIIDAIKGKIERILSENDRLREETQKLAAGRDRLKAENREMAARIASLEERIAVLELKGAMAGGSEDAKLAKARVNRLMREVDRCIALLSRE